MLCYCWFSEQNSRTTKIHSKG